MAQIVDDVYDVYFIDNYLGHECGARDWNFGWKKNVSVRVWEDWQERGKKWFKHSTLPVWPLVKIYTSYSKLNSFLPSAFPLLSSHSRSFIFQFTKHAYFDRRARRFLFFSPRAFHPDNVSRANEFRSETVCENNCTMRVLHYL